MLIVAPVAQRVSTQHVADVSGEVHAGLEEIFLNGQVQPGMRIAIAVGSRGISCLRDVVEPVVHNLRTLGALPFIVPAMGSHGGGTADGQKAVLESYGLSEAALGIPIVSSMETVRVGETTFGMPVYFDLNAVDADGIIVINRIKQHTAFRARWESGLVKMLAVGLGEARGAAEIHNWGLSEAIPAAATVILEKLPILAGIAIVENGQHEPARIAVLPAERILPDEAAMLEFARTQLPKIPSSFEPLDLVVLQEMGKDISGTGMDLNVIGMWRRLGGPIEPRISVVATLDLTASSHGNAIGVGHADLITEKLKKKVNLDATYTNGLTSHNLQGAKIPLTVPTERDVFNASLAGIDPALARVVIARNTLELSLLWVSQALLGVVASDPSLDQLDEARPLEFNDEHDLILTSLE